MFDLLDMAKAADVQLRQAQQRVDVLAAITDLRIALDRLGLSVDVSQADAARVVLSVPFGDVKAVSDPDTTDRADEVGGRVVAWIAEAAAGVIDTALCAAYEEVAGPEKVVTAGPAPLAAAEPLRGFVSGPLSDAEVKTSYEMIDAGAACREIAVALGRKPNAMNAVVPKLIAKRKKVADQPANEAQDAAPRPKSAAVAAGPVPFAKRAGVASLPSRAPTAPPVSRSAADRPYAERAAAAHLAAVGYTDGWTAARDLELVEEICRGSNLAVIATELQVGFAAAQKRWRVLNQHIGDTDHQVVLLRILRERALIDAALAVIPEQERRVPMAATGMLEIKWDGARLRIAGIAGGLRGLQAMRSRGAQAGGRAARSRVADRNARIRDDARAGMTYAALMAKYEVSKQMIYKITARAGVAVVADGWRSEDAKALTARIAALADGVRTLGEIADKAGCSKWSVRARRDQLGLDIPHGVEGQHKTQRVLA